MGVSIGTSKGRGKGRRRGGPISEINVTPLVDVMLVLLIVFMVAAPMMTMGVPIDLPKTSAPPMTLERKPITVTVAPDGTISVEKAVVTLEGLLPVIASLAGEGAEERLYVRGDATAAYGNIMKVLGSLSAAGYSRIGLITEPEPRP
ncbi:biopolymer transporter ExbD [Devosia limi DSM 17137]|uniref:Biopolymer transporter ExbD n=1 Tax=Devosia limi DSM 17137 TaxID=1121477 RepID=A0A0F5LS47_9HYPH|nr:biopolymer transporter ExbD [Devosia limi]KKB84989.1 biopolymer transporter ExbD [Devosia limi DSM 17137]SHF02400.1 Cell division and transport-associated protein TolR (TC 2.C.1.2.1) [Devosia limi DSM 17137]